MREGNELIQASKEFAVEERQKSWQLVFVPFALLLAALAGAVWNVHNARIPSYRFEEAMDAMPELQAPGVTSWRLKDVQACLGLALWDPEQERMVRWEAVRT